MSFQQQRSGNVSEVVLWVGKVSGLAIALLATPPLFKASRGFLFLHFSDFVGEVLGWLLTWVMALVEAALIYGVVTVVFAYVVGWLLMVMAARGL